MKIFKSITSFAESTLTKGSFCDFPKENKNSINKMLNTSISRGFFFRLVELLFCVRFKNSILTLPLNDIMLAKAKADIVGRLDFVNSPHCY